MADPMKRIKVLVIKQMDEEVTEKKGKEKEKNSKEELIISDKESVCNLKKKEEESIEEKEAAAIEEEEKAKEAAAAIEEEEKAKEAAAAAAYTLKGKAKMIDLEEKLVQEEEKAEVKKKPIQNLIQQLTDGLPFEVDIIICNTTDDLLTDDLLEIDMWEIKFVFVEEIFFQRIFLFITEVPAFVSIPFVFCSSNPNWQVLQKSSKYKKGSSAGIHIEDVPGDMGFINSLMQDDSSIPEFKANSSHSDSCGHQDEGEVGQEVEEEELQVEAPGPPQPIKPKKRWQRDWDQ